MPTERKKTQIIQVIESFNYFMSYLIAESQLRILDFNRIVKDLNGLSTEEFITSISKNYKIEKKKFVCS